MENPIKMDDLQGKNPIFGNIHMLNSTIKPYEKPPFGEYLWVFGKHLVQANPSSFLLPESSQGIFTGQGMNRKKQAPSFFKKVVT